jgi:hypothetical protein
VAAAVQQERDRVWSYPETRDFLDELTRLQRGMAHQWGTVLDEVRTLAAAYLPAGAEAAVLAAHAPPQAVADLPRRQSQPSTPRPAARPKRHR